jgi:hypothetical protein
MAGNPLSWVERYLTGLLLRDAVLFEVRAATGEIRRMFIGNELFKED